ncbi:MAG: thiolase family protein [Elusimicrobia bacterium]|nr:thiolase family protein [Elusimicrobiota bacterium]
MQRVAVIGAAQTVFEARKEAETYADLVYEVADQALKDAGMDISEMGNIVTASNDFLDGRTISSMAVGDAAGAAFGGGLNISTVEGDGAFAAFYGLSRILSGGYSTTLVTAHSKSSEGDPLLISNACFDPVYERALGLDFVSAAALQARVYMERRGLSERDLAEVVRLNRAKGVLNPYAQVRREISISEVLASKPLAPPIRELDAGPLSDGAAAIILAGEDFARRRCSNPVWIEGVSLCADARMTGRNLWESAALRKAAQTAYRMAGISDPLREIDVAEIYAAFSYQEPLWLEELGLGAMDKSRVSPSGGCLCAHAPISAGLVRVIEAVLQLRGKAANQAPEPRRTLAHAQSGICGQSHCVWILGKNG